MKSQKILINTLMFLVLSTVAWAANPSPVIFYSDLTAGLNTGGQNNLGAFVTIWGNNFGSAQGSSYVTVGGGKVNNYPTWTNTMICFQLGSSAATGNIVVTTPNGSSNGVAFTITTTGHIYFVQPGASSNGTGSYSSPYSHLYYAYQTAVPGDTIYILAGTIENEVDGYNNWHSMIDGEVQDGEPEGTSANPIAFIAYPNATVNLVATGATATWTDGSSGGTDNVSYIFRDVQYAVISKLNLQDSGGSSAIGGIMTNARITGNTIQATNMNYGVVDLTANNWHLLGNTFTGNTCTGSCPNNETHSVYIDGTNENVEVGWNYFHNNYGQGWEISSYHNGPRIGTIHDNLLINDNLTDGGEKGMLVDGCYQSGDTGSSLYTNNMEVYNNVLINEGQYEYGGAIQANCGTNYIYNNTIYGAGAEVEGAIQFESGGVGPNGGNPVEYIANNIIDLPGSSELYYSDSNGNTPYSDQTFSLITNNNYYGTGNGPSQDLHPINANPQLVSPTDTTSGNWQLQSTSPDIAAGYNTISIVLTDFTGLLRSTTPSIGAYQYTSATPSPVVSITSPSTGNTVTVGANINISATASETNGTITNIAIYNGSTLLGSSSSSPYTYTMTNPAAGTYALSAVATDANGVSTTSSPVTVTVTTQSVTPSSPVVTITSPASGSSYAAGSNVTVTTTASETNGTVSNISLYNGSGILLGSSNSSPYNYVYSDILAGTYTFYAVAKDANGVSTTSSSITLTVTAPTVPTVAITSPASGSTFVLGSNITFAASASETNGSIAKVSYYYNGSNLLASSTTSPYSYIVPAGLVGTYTITAVATDANGVSTTSSPITISEVASQVSTSAPVVTITSPANGNSFVLGSNVTFTASASETNGSIAKVSYYYNGSNLLASSTTSPYSYIVPAGLVGTYTITAVATDANGVSTTSSPITISEVASQVSTSAPVVTITSPANGNSFVLGSNVTFTASASETNGSIAKVSYYYNGSNLLASSTTSPYSYIVPAGLVGTYTITAIAKDANGVSTTSSPITIYEVAPSVPVATVAPSITTQPVSATVTAPTTATFTVAATGTPAPSFQWMQSVSGGAFTNISGATSTSYTVPVTAMTNNGNQFKCVVSNTSGSMTSNMASLTVTPTPVVPSITTQPVSATVTAPATATFTVAATGTPAPSLQWMQSINGGAFTNISGATSASYTTAATTTANSGTQFKCVISNTSGSVTSNEASLTVNPAPVAPSITSQLASVTVTAPATATFTVAATGTPAPTFQWMQSISGGAFSNISGATSASYTTATTTAANSGTEYVCVITNASGSITSNAASLTVNPTPLAPSITSQPASVTVTAPATATFTVAATGTPAPTYQWMQSLNGGAFTNISGATSASYRTAATTTANSGTEYVCVVSNASGSVTSNAASLTVNPAPAAPSITTQPVSATVTAPATTTFSVAATGTPAPTFQWMQSVNGGAFSNISGATGTSYTTAASTTDNSGTQFKCVVSNGSGSVTSNTATLTVNPAPVAPSFTAQPVSVTVTAPATATFTVNVGGIPPPTFQWMKSVNGGAFTDINGATSASYTTAATSTADSGTQYECVASNASGSVTSNAAILTVVPAPTALPNIITQPVNATVSAPSSTTFTVVATSPSAQYYQWYQSVGGIFFPLNKQTGASYTIPSTRAALNGTQYLCVITNAYGSVISNLATLNIG